MIKDPDVLSELVKTLKMEVPLSVEDKLAQLGVKKDVKEKVEAKRAML